MPLVNGFWKLDNFYTPRNEKDRYLDDCYYYYYSECKKKKRNQIPCFWEDKPGGCQKPHCMFYHSFKHQDQEIASNTSKYCE